jgi:hypothetical protein
MMNVTLDPGGSDADGAALPPLALSVESTVAELVIEACIMGPVSVTSTGFVDRLTLRDSIIHTLSPGLAPLAINQPDGTLEIHSCTVLGRITAHLLEATELLCSEKITVANLQSGCLRFSAFGADSVVPRAYRCVTIDDTQSLFVSARFGDPGYCQLSEICPDDITRGGEDATEIGAFRTLLNPVKVDSLHAKVDELIPFGLIPLFIMET